MAWNKLNNRRGRVWEYDNWKKALHLFVDWEMWTEFEVQLNGRIENLRSADCKLNLWHKSDNW